MNQIDRSFNYRGLPCIYSDGRYYLINYYTLQSASFKNPGELNDPDSIKRLIDEGIIGTVANPDTIRDELHLTFILTTDCNLRCDYCYTESKIQKLFLSPKTAKDIIDSLFGQGFVGRVYVQFFGGEPTLNIPAIKTILNRVRSHSSNPFFYITTNGTFDEHVLQLLIDERIGLYLSLDGIGEYHDLHRKTVSGEGTYSVVMKNLESVLQAGLPCKIRSTITPDNVAGMTAFTEEMFRMGVRLIHFTPVANVGFASGKDDLEADEVFQDTYVSNLVKALSIAEHYGAQLVTPLSLALKRGARPHCKIFSNTTKYIITPEGKLSFCYGIQSSANSFSNLFLAGKLDPNQGRFSHSDSVRRNLEVAYETIVRNYCSDCFASFVCGGGCFVQNLSACGSLLELNKSFCSLQKKIVYALLLKMLK